MTDVLARDLRPRQIMTKEAFENAIAVVMAVAGSTNAVLHLLAIAREAHVDLTLDDFDRVSRRTPAPRRRSSGGQVRDERPRPRRRRARRAAGAARPRAAARRLPDRDRQDPGGEPGRREAAGARRRRRASRATRPIHPWGGIAILRGNAGARRRRDQGRGHGGHGLRGHGPCVRLRAGGVRRAHGRRDRRRRRRGDPLRRTEGIAGDARDARRDRGGRRRRARQGRRVDHRRTVQRGDEGHQRRAHRAGSLRRGSDRVAARTATGSGSTPTAARSTRSSTTRSSNGAVRSWTEPAPKYTQGALAKYARTVGSADTGATTW